MCVTRHVSGIACRATLGCVRYSAVPTMHEAILLEAEARGEKLRHSITLMRNCSAALLPPVSERFLKAFGTNLNQPFKVLPTYAMTESFPICSNPPHLEIKLGTVGPAMGPAVKILKVYPEHEAVPQGEEGEVCVSGACVTSGYLIRDHMGTTDPNIEAFTPSASSVGRSQLGFKPGILGDPLPPPPPRPSTTFRIWKGVYPSYWPRTIGTRVI